MAIKIMTAIQKGGQAKTTTSVIMAEILAASGYNVLVVDLDSQGNATQMLSGLDIYEFEGKTIYEAMVEDNPHSYVFEAKKGLHFMAAEDMMALFSRYIYTSDIRRPAEVLGRTLKQIESLFDFIIMDCPPNLSDIVTNAVVYSDYILIPVDIGAFGKDGLKRFVRFVDNARADGHTQAEVLGIVFTMRDSRSRHEKKLVDEVRKTYGKLVFDTEIRRRAKIKESAADGVSLENKKDAKVFADYLKLTDEIIERLKNGGGK